MKKSPFQLINQKLIRCSFEKNDNMNNYDLPIEVDCKTEIYRKTDKNEAKVLFTISLFNKKDINEVPFKMELTHEGFFNWEDSVTEKQINNLLNINAPAILLSYDRSIISMITSYADLPKVMIPLLNFHSKEI